jgi:molybdenum cofactor cytidylyltransferase
MFYIPRQFRPITLSILQLLNSFFKMFSAIVPAAGMSTRLGRNKLLLPFKGQPLIAHAVDTLMASKVDEIIVVLGHEAEQVRAAIGNKGVRFVENPDYRLGLSTSVRAGFAAVPVQTTGIMIYLADQPLLKVGEVDFLIGALAEAGKANKSIVVPLFRGQRGNPVIVKATYKASLLAITGEAGCRRLIKQNPDQVLTVEMETDHVVRDIDTIEAYDRLLAQESG